MNPIRTLEDLIHEVTNSLGIISSHSQYLLGKRPAGVNYAEELQVIYEETERAANLLNLVPRGLAKVPVQDAHQRLDPKTVERPGGVGGADHGKGCR
ncbi:MAG: hypothetical protein HY897_01015 [Deltaproteobacteria bacterium]|nr:hypothetical protein [Deltaproteobacteria bacterium]